MLKWVVKPVESPYGSVDTMHWAVPDDDGDHDHIDGTGYATSHHGDDGADAETALQVALETAEDQLGAVLWNSNTAALNYLHKHILSSSRRRTKAARGQAPSQSGSVSPAGQPLKGLSVIELGAGVGCLGIALALGGASVAITDLKELVPLMKHNVTLNADRVKHAGQGRCAAMEWKWGPSVSLNPAKHKPRPERGGDEGGGVALEAMLTALRAPSQPFRAVQAFLQGEKGEGGTVDYVILCDALYGNPKDWPSLLYTLTEILATNPRGCTVVNFCEQRVEDVEGAFLELLREQNRKSRAEELTSPKGKDGLIDAAELKARALQQVLLEKRGTYKWRFHTETVAEAQSELDMTIRATTIQWVSDDDSSDQGADRLDDAKDANSEPARKRPRA